MSQDTPSVIVHGPHACGKTRNAQFIANHFGLTHIFDEYNGEPLMPFDWLALTNRTDLSESRDYHEVMDEIAKDLEPDDSRRGLRDPADQAMKDKAMAAYRKETRRET